MGGCNFRNMLPVQVPKSQRWKICVFDRKLSKASEIHSLELGLYPSIMDIVEAMKSLIRERHNHREGCVPVKIPRRTQKVNNYLASEGPYLAFSSTELGNIFSTSIGKEFGKILRGKRLQKPEFVYDFVRIHSLMICTDHTEYNIFGDTSSPIMRCFLFILKLKAENVITIGQYMKYQTISNLQFNPLLKNSFHNFQNDLRDASCENNTLCFCRYHSFCFDV